MAKKSLSGTIHKEAVPKRTSIGHGRRKRGSFKNSKKYRGQGKG